jgi:two-component system, NarL family, sensor histidine kinase DevS
VSGISGGEEIALDEQRLRKLIEAARALVSELELEVVLERLLEAARELTGAAYAALGILNPERTALERFLTVGIDAGTRAVIGDLPRGRGVLGLLISDPRPLRLDDVGEHPRSYGLPPGHPPMAAFLGVPIMIRGEAYGNLYLTEKRTGEAFTEADEQAAVVLAEWAAVAIENARLYEAADGQRRELERIVHRLEAMTEITRVVGGETDLGRILGTVVKRGRALVSATWLAILLPEQDELVVAAIAGEQSAERRGMRIPIKGSLPGAALEAMTPARHKGLRERRATRGDVWFEAEAELLVPMGFRGAGIGVLLAGDPLGERREFGAEDERLLGAFAASAATAVATARSVAEDRLRDSISAAERERGRWARELHDETLQGLGALRVLLASGLRGSSEALAQAAREATSQLDSEIQNLRALIAELRPAVLDEIGVEAAIQGLADRVSATAGLAVDTELSLSGTGARSDPGSELESTIYRVVQEALTNVVKHSRAEHVRLSVVEHDGVIEVSVDDDGVGFDPAARHEGFGLAGMRERVAMVDGRMELTSAPGAGATMRVVIPVNSSA